MLAFATAAGIYAQDDYYESKPLYSLPKIIDGQSAIAKKTSPIEENTSATIKRVQIDETKNTLLATENGLKKINANGKQTTLWKEGAVH